MRKLTLILLTWGLLPADGQAKEHPKIKIQIIDARSSQRAFTYTTPGRSGTASTTCNSNGNGTLNTSTYGNNTYGTVDTNTQTNCNTTSTPATPPQTYTSYIQQEFMKAVLPNGAQITLWCQAGFRKCYQLQPGYYDAEITGGSTMQVIVTDLRGKEHKVKYRSVAD
jgi:hypothetical protein